MFVGINHKIFGKRTRSWGDGAWGRFKAGVKFMVCPGVSPKSVLRNGIAFVPRNINWLFNGSTSYPADIETRDNWQMLFGGLVDGGPLKTRIRALKQPPSTFWPQLKDRNPPKAGSPT